MRIIIILYAEKSRYKNGIDFKSIELQIRISSALVIVHADNYTHTKVRDIYFIYVIFKNDILLYRCDDEDMCFRLHVEIDPYWDNHRSGKR